MKKVLRSLFLMIILLAAAMGSNTAWAVSCGSTFWGKMADDCGYDRARCYCDSQGDMAGCTNGDTTYMVDCSDGSGSCSCFVMYANVTTSTDPAVTEESE
jgi:hypothetical protein